MKKFCLVFILLLLSVQLYAEKAKLKDEAERKAQIIQELNLAGRQTRLDLAKGFIIPGAALVFSAQFLPIGGILATFERNDYRDKYSQSNGSEAEKYRKKAEKADKKANAYAAMTYTCLGLGLAMVATGVVFFSIKFKGEQKVMKKYNLSFGTSPTNGTLQLALNW